MTLFQILTEGTRILQMAGVPNAKNDAQQLLLAAFHLDLTHFLLRRMEEIKETEYTGSCAALYGKMIEQRRKRCPLQQILGSQEFMGLQFYINRHVLIPRQDTEALVELVLKEQTDPQKRVLDVCTGSGCIAISLAVKGGYRWVTAADISEDALKVARRNAESLASDCYRKGQRIQFLQGDLFCALESGNKKKFQVITSNPPYIPTAVIHTLEPEVRDHEPILALDGAEDGLYYYRRIAVEAIDYLEDGAAIYLEIGHNQGLDVSRLLNDAGYQDVRVCKDLAGKERVVCAVWGGSR